MKNVVGIIVILGMTISFLTVHSMEKGNWVLIKNSLKKKNPLLSVKKLSIFSPECLRRDGSFGCRDELLADK